MGCSGFGLEDSVAIQGISCAKQDFYLADVLLATHVFGRMWTGPQAKEERTHTGLHWPLEARVEDGGYLRRVPVSYAWRLLVEAGDTLRRWSIENGVSFPVERILAEHIKFLFQDQGFKKGDDRAVVAIPNDLDEFAQENLLRELKDWAGQDKDNNNNLLLVWRPIAAALSWLDRIQDKLPDPRDDDALLVLYLGPDGFEFVPLRLRKRDHQGQRYIIPLRDRPGSYFPWAGFDWAARVIEEMWTDLPVGAFWQAFSGFPEVWQALAQRPLADLMRPWSLANEWTFWHPGSEFQENIWRVRPAPSPTLSKLSETSCPRPGGTLPPIFQTCEEMLQAEIRRSLDAVRPGHLWGVIICGALAPTSLPRWLTSISTIFEDRGVQLDGSLSEPRPRGLWLTAQGDDPIAEGASIYGQRTWAGIHTYLDTLPQLSIYAMKQCQYDWIPLVDAVEWEGGKEYYKPIKGKFKLREGTADLDVYLKKGEQAESPYAAMVPTRGLNKEWVEMAQHKVESLGSLQAVFDCPGLQHDSDYVRYARAYAHALYSDENEGRQKIKPYRMAKFNFPLAPEEDKILDLEVRMRPASGMAKVQIIPREASFLRGRQVFLNYSTMVPINELPELEKGAPDINTLDVEPEDSMLLSQIELFDRFNNIMPQAHNYFITLRSIRNVLTRTVNIFEGMRFSYFKTIDQDGNTNTAQGQAFIDILSHKISQDYDIIANNIQLKRYELKIFVDATWLFLKTPRNVVNRLRELLKRNYNTIPRWNWTIEAASRCFETMEEFTILFATICERIKRPPDTGRPFPIQADRAVWRVLAFREKGFEGLERHQAKLLTDQSVGIMEGQAGLGNFQKRYFQAAQLFFFLLRFRCKDPSFLNPENPDDQDMFDRAISCLKKAETYFRGRPGGQRAHKILEGIKEYMYFRGKGTLVFDEFTEGDADGAGDN